MALDEPLPPLESPNLILEPVFLLEEFLSPVVVLFSQFSQVGFFSFYLLGV